MLIVGHFYVTIGTLTDRNETSPNIYSCNRKLVMFYIHFEFVYFYHIDVPVQHIQTLRDRQNPVNETQYPALLTKS